MGIRAICHWSVFPPGEKDGCRVITFGRERTVSGHLPWASASWGLQPAPASSFLLSLAQPAQHQPELSLGHHPSSGAMVLEGNKTTATIVVVKIIAAGNIDIESIYVCQALLLVL